MTKRVIFFAIILLLIYPVKGFAQMDERKPGIYAVVGEESLPLTYTYGGTTGVGVGVGIVGIGSARINYDGVTSGVNAADTLVLVINPKQVVGTISARKYNNFHSKMTPDDILILPFVVNKKKDQREYDFGLAVGVGIGLVGMGGTTKENERPTFKWERISDNSFQIVVPNLDPGEYGAIFRPSRFAEYEYSYMFGFTIPEPVEEATAQDDTIMQIDTVMQNDTTIQNDTVIKQ